MWLLLALLAAVGLALAFSGEAGSFLGIETGTFIRLATGFALIVFVGGWLFHAYKGHLPRAARDVFVWAILMLALVAGYSFREEFALVGRRVVSELLPPGEAISVDSGRPGEAAVRLRRRGDGHFVARADVNGNNVYMMIDTGASTVVLSSSDARRVGINVEALSYTIPVNTANGTTYAAAVRLRHIGVGPIMFDRVDALVAKPGSLNESLLGMTFLTRLKSYEFSKDYLTLRG